ncbi:MAG: hypothetical protein RR101_13320 [Burkholderiaceae bacterium]
MKKRSRSSAQIALVLIGVGGTLAGCSQQTPQEVTRDRYATLEDCAADWGRPEACDADKASAPRAGGMPFFLGPMYPFGFRGNAQAAAWGEAHRLGRTPAPGVMPADRSIGRTPSMTQRGGFGSSGSRFSAGG